MPDALKKNLTKEAVMSKLHKLDANRGSFTGNLHDITSWEIGEGNFTITMNDETYRFGEWAQTQLLKKLKIPRNYFLKCSKDLRDQEFREGLDALSKGEENRFKFWLDPETNEKMVYGFIPMNCPDVLPSEIVEKVLNGAGSLEGVVIAEGALSSLDSLRLRLYDSNRNFGTVGTGELFPAMDFVFSDVLRYPIKCQSALFRKECENGLIIPVELNDAFQMPLMRYNEDLFNSHIQFVCDAGSRLDVISKSFDELRKIELPEALINGDADERNSFDDVLEYVIPRKPDRDSIAEPVKREYNADTGNHTVFGLINAVTATVRDYDEGMDGLKCSVEEGVGKFITRISIQEQTREGFKYDKEGLDTLFKKKKN